ncbi:para-nitrobenzyl esterase [Sphingopyxis panaciterrae]|uniref:carboxylesterase/lipase family protein n=1 Tax=Sphingopyxis panaciterrae TaxID=363841 RepID=UPI001422E5C5|nr:carboxylesterase family protein [Sphingopyxis panaciterrae]NIJ35920.1 para-nitrobenzyl esterase [Sphingopyxis panaciterrae]
MKSARTAVRLTLLACAWLLAPAVDAQEARVESGALHGAVDDGVVRFLGIPYAAPPVGERRWAPPEAPPAWQGSRDATTHGAACMQPITPDGFGPWTSEYVTPAPVSEDCLTLNVWAPEKRGARPLPVMLWIHGGAFMSGSNSVPIYDGAALARQGIVVVSINYRLGVFGFAGFHAGAGDPGSGTNFGLQDILAALRWTQRNIGAFGGDPGQVTVAGQSAGAMAVHMLLLSPQADGLFARAIAQSGIIETPLPQRDDAYRRGDDLLARAKLADVGALRQLPAEQVMALLDAGPLAGTADVGGMPLLGPVVDGTIVPGQIAALEAEGRRRAVPVMVGLTADEGVLNPDYFRTTAAEVTARAARMAGDTASAAQLLGTTPADDGAAIAANRRLTRLYGQASVIDWAADHHAPLFAYYFTHPEPGPGSAMFGAFHSAEIPYVFDSLHASPGRPFTDVDREIARRMSGYWVNFVKRGDPNGGDLPHWPRFATAAPGLMELGDHFARYKGDRGVDLLVDRMPQYPGRSIFGIGSFAAPDAKK